jgi:hypothetical protein
MDDDEYYSLDDMPTVNRSAITLEPTEAYKQWARSCPGGDPEGHLADWGNDERTVYLIPEIDYKPDAWLRKNYLMMFEYELNGWWTDEAAWPTDRSFKNFKTFFKIHFTSMVLDLGKGAIEHDEL